VQVRLSDQIISSRFVGSSCKTDQPKLLVKEKDVIPTKEGDQVGEFAHFGSLLPRLPSGPPCLHNHRRRWNPFRPSETCVNLNLCIADISKSTSSSVVVVATVSIILGDRLASKLAPSCRR